MVFVGENVSLEENILKKSIEFVKDWLQWSAENREQVVISKTEVLGSASIFLIVPPTNTIIEDR